MAATNGDLHAQAMVLRIEERRAKLLGLDAPQRLKDVSEFADAKRTLLEKLNKMAARMRLREQNAHPLIEHDAVGDGAKLVPTSQRRDR